jgi:hypothetical protein
METFASPCFLAKNPETAHRAVGIIRIPDTMRIAALYPAASIIAPVMDGYGKSPIR